jgi:DivIVA domain-containing protein
LLEPDQIQARQFLVSLRGYDRDEVHAFLEQVADEVRTLRARVAELETSPAQQGGAPSAPVAPPAVAGSPADTSDPSALFAEIGRQTQRILEAAQEAGEELKHSAKQEADREVQAARSQAARAIAEGERRLEATERVVAELERARDRLAGELRGVGRALEGALRDLVPEPHADSSVREALTAAAAAEPEAEPERRVEAAPPLEPRDEAPAPSPTAEQAPAEALAEPAEQAPGEALAEPVEQAPADAPAEAAEPPRAAGGDAEADGAHALRDDALAPLQPQLVRSLKRGLQDLHNVALDRLRRAEGKGEADDFLPTDAELAALADLSGDVLDHAYRAGLDAAAALAGNDLAPPAAARDLDSALVADASERLRATVGATLRLGVSADEDLTVLSDRVGAAFGELRSDAADDLANVHLVRAYELALLDAWAAGGVTSRRWVLGREPRCPEGRCRQNDQAGALAVGEAFPSGHEAPPVHSGCTCTTVPS